MTDVMTKEQRSRCMASIRGRNTSPEINLRKVLWAKGLRYRLRYKLVGKPDLVFVKERVALFVDGCFWHRCHKHSNLPKNNAPFWAKKLSRNVERDTEVTQALRDAGWTVIRIWEHSLKNGLPSTVARIIKAVKKNRQAIPLKR